MTCNKKEITVTRSLLDALRTFRRPDRLRILWADAICINQQDLEERSQQVQFMTRVFSEAKRVLIWLEHCEESTVRLVFEYTCHYINKEMRNIVPSNQHAYYH